MHAGLDAVREWKKLLVSVNANLLTLEHSFPLVFNEVNLHFNCMSLNFVTEYLTCQLVYYIYQKLLSCP